MPLSMRWLIATSCLIATAQTPPPAKPVAGIPVNYDELKVGTYTLPDPLVLSDGKPLGDAKTWVERRRPEIVRLFEENEYGRSPARPSGMTFEVSEKATRVFDGKAIRRQVIVHFSTDKKMTVLMYLPAQSTKPVPFLLHLSFAANSTTVDDPGLKEGEVWGPDKKLISATQGRKFAKVDPLPLINAGFGFGTIYYGDIEPDFEGGLPYGVRSLYPKPAPDEWGAIAAWAWGLSRAMDYLETDKQVDAKRVAIMGVSRLGKTVMWAGARDTRFALVIASCSGEGARPSVAGIMAKPSPTSPRLRAIRTSSPPTTLDTPNMSTRFRSTRTC